MPTGSAAPGTTVVASALLQTVIHVVTAAILGSVVIILTAVLTSAVLGRFVPAIPVIDVTYAPGLIGVRLALTVLATVLPVAARSQASVALQLAVK